MASVDKLPKRPVCSVAFDENNTIRRPSSSIRYRRLVIQRNSFKKDMEQVTEKMNSYFIRALSETVNLSEQKLNQFIKKYSETKDLLFSNLTILPSSLNVSITDDPSLHFTFVFGSKRFLFIECFLEDDGSIDTYVIISEDSEHILEENSDLNRIIHKVSKSIQN